MIASRQQTTQSNELSWKGTVLLVGMLALLMLLSGCYTIVATSRFSGGVSSAYDYGYDEAEVDEEVVTAGTKIPSKVFSEAAAAGTDAGQQGVGVRIPDTQIKSGVDAVGVRYRSDYEYYGDQYYDDTWYGDQYYNDGYGMVSDPGVFVVGYRRPWIRRLYVDWYYGNCYGWYRWPHRFGSTWSVSWRWGGFGVAYGYHEPYWYDPFYWDYWWSDPFYSYQPYFVSYWDPWRWGSHWYRPYHYGYYDPYWGPYHYYDDPWYGGRYRGVVVVEDYERRPADRRRGVTDLRNARRPVGTAADRAAVTVADGSGDNARRDSRTRVGTDTGTRTGTGDVRTPTREADRTTTRTASPTIKDTKIRTTPPANSGISRIRETARSIGNELIRRYTGRSVGSSSSTARTSSRTRNGNTQTGSSGTRTTTRPPTTSSRTRTSVTRRPPTSSRTRTTTSRPPPGM